MNRTNSRSANERPPRLLLAALLTGTLAVQATPAYAVSAEQLKLLERLEQIERMEREEFMQHIDRAAQCTITRDFKCAERALAASEKLAADTKAKNTWRTAKANLASEREALAQEIEAERREQERLRRQMEKEQEEAEQREREYNEAMRREQQRIEDEEYDAEQARSWKEWAQKGQQDTAAFVAQYRQNAENIQALQTQIRNQQAQQAEERQRQRQQALAQYEANTQTRNRQAEERQAARLQELERKRQEQVRQQQADAERRRQEAAQRAQAEAERQRLAAQRAEEQRQKTEREAPCLNAGGRVTYDGYCQLETTIMSPRSTATPQKTWLPIGRIAGVEFHWIWVQSSKIMGNWAWKARNTNGHMVEVAARGVAVCSDGTTMEERSRTMADLRPGKSFGQNDQWSGTASTLCDGKGVDPVQGGVDASVKWSLK